MPLRYDRTTAWVLVACFFRGCLALFCGSTAPGLLFALCALFNDEEQTVWVDLNKNIALSPFYISGVLHSLSWSASRRARPTCRPS